MRDLGPLAVERICHWGYVKRWMLNRGVTIEASELSGVLGAKNRPLWTKVTRTIIVGGPEPNAREDSAATGRGQQALSHRQALIAYL